MIEILRASKILGFSRFLGFSRDSRQVWRLSEGAGAARRLFDGAARLARLALLQ
jgi:hypothetical protein